jgi:hypothetical protein
MDRWQRRREEDGRPDGEPHVPDPTPDQHVAERRAEGSKWAVPLQIRQLHQSLTFPTAHWRQAVCWRIVRLPAGYRWKERHFVIRMYSTVRFHKIVVDGAPYGLTRPQGISVAWSPGTQMTDKRLNGVDIVRQHYLLVRGTNSFP